jgi:hypothetical protein
MFNILISIVLLWRVMKADDETAHTQYSTIMHLVLPAAFAAIGMFADHSSLIVSIGGKSTRWWVAFFIT